MHSEKPGDEPSFSIFGSIHRKIPAVHALAWGGAATVRACALSRAWPVLRSGTEEVAAPSMHKKGKPSGARLGLQVRLSCSSFPIARYGKSQNYFTGAKEKAGRVTRLCVVRTVQASNLLDTVCGIKKQRQNPFVEAFTHARAYAHAHFFRPPFLLRCSPIIDVKIGKVFQARKKCDCADEPSQ